MVNYHRSSNWHYHIEKTAILRALAEGVVPGVPANLQLLLLGQTFVTMNNLALNSADETHQDTKSVLEYVVTSNARRERTLRQAKCMSARFLRATVKKLLFVFIRFYSTISCIGWRRRRYWDNQSVTRGKTGERAKRPSTSTTDCIAEKRCSRINSKTASYCGGEESRASWATVG